MDIGDGLIGGIRSMKLSVMETMTELWNAMNSSAGLAGNFGSQFVSQTLDPLRAGVAAAESQLADWNDAMAAIATQLGYGPDFIHSPGMVTELNRLINYQYASDEQRDQARVLLSFLDDRNRMQLEYVRLQQELAAEEARLAALDEKKRQNQFLQEQLNLLKFLRENNIAADVLDGITLGINADAGALMDVMRNVLARLIATAQAELGIASPSRKFFAMGQNLMSAVGLGIIDQRAVTNIMREAMGNVVAAGQRVSQTTVDNGRVAHLYGGQHFHIEKARTSVLDDMQVLLAP